eukprot:TRINITY_DN20151_c0_g1_i1.p1 TRINITY_DN20151_c0_g1~~TRINITY_DN20151_c0_g1_i1.p1  ORF type:complete len:137 (-),score=4.76 TRINITY_DN20151_c0_g1_i1:103-513(-)
MDYTPVFFYMVTLIVDCVFVFGNVYFLALYSDLESDHTNPIDMCKQVNAYSMPEMIGHAVFTVLFLLTGNYYLFLLNLPLLAWHAYRFQKRQHRIDPTQVFRVLGFETKVLYCKLAFYMVCFCVYLFTLIRAVIGR